MKLRKTDTLFRKFLLLRDEYTCQRCRRQYQPDNCRGLQVSHYWGRSRENTRFDEENCILLCWGCHQLWGHGDLRVAYESYMRAKLGEDGFDLLEARAYTYKKRDDKLDELAIKALLKEVQ